MLMNKGVVVQNSHCFLKSYRERNKVTSAFTSSCHSTARVKFPLNLPVSGVSTLSEAAFER